jgi:hypothetical protein
MTSPETNDAPDRPAVLVQVQGGVVQHIGTTPGVATETIDWDDVAEEAAVEIQAMIAALTALPATTDGRLEALAGLQEALATAEANEARAAHAGLLTGLGLPDAVLEHVVTAITAARPEEFDGARSSVAHVAGRVTVSDLIDHGLGSRDLVRVLTAFEAAGHPLKAGHAAGGATW